jgi:protease-4
MSGRGGVLAFVLALTILGAAVLAVAIALRRPTASVHAAAVLVFDVPASLDEAEPPYGPFSLRALRASRVRVHEVVRALTRAAGDDHIVGLVLRIDGVDWGWARIHEVRDAVLAFRAAGKPVVASLAGGDEREYLLSTAASTVCMPPTARLQFDGLALTATFLRGTFDKAGIRANYVQVGAYKSGAESYTRTGFSAAGREALEGLLDDQFSLLVDSLASARRVDPDSIRALMDEGPYTATGALAAGLVDTLLYDAEVDSLATRRGAVHLPTVTLQRYLERLASARGPRVALVVAAGTIAPGRSREDPMEGRVLGSETLVDALRVARTRSAVRAVVLRIDSPGGVAQATDDLWREVARCREVKPVIVSMGDDAASGGYYMAVAADRVIAQPATVTGSIGIYGGKLNLAGLFEKLGVGVETLSRGRRAEMLSSFHDFTPEERAVYESHLREFHQGFLERVAQGRHMSVAEVDSVAEGRVWSGLAAYDLGLVDTLGGLETAFAEARERAGIGAGEELTVEVYPRAEHPFLSRLLADWLDQDAGAREDALLPEALRGWIVASRFPAGVPLALLPWSIEIR